MSNLEELRAEETRLAKECIKVIHDDSKYVPLAKELEEVRLKLKGIYALKDVIPETIEMIQERQRSHQATVDVRAMFE